MADSRLGDTASILHTTQAATTSSSVLTPRPANNFLSGTDASAMTQFSLELRELEAVSVLSGMCQVLRPN